VRIALDGVFTDPARILLEADGGAEPRELGEGAVVEDRSQNGPEGAPMERKKVALEVR
jgi:hypothetical protein